MALAVVWAPLPFGSVPPWAESVLQALSFALAGLGLLVASGERWKAARAPAIGLLGIGALGALQAVAWPAGLVSMLSPAHARLAAAAAKTLQQGVPARLALSLAPSASTSAGLAFAAAAAALVAAATLGAERLARRFLGGAIVLAALFQSFVGAQLWFARSRSIWGVEVPTQPWRLHGTFVNPDHLAAFLELGLAVAFAWGWWGWRRGRSEGRLEARLLLAGPPAIIWLVIFLALAFTGSRAGLIAAVAATAVQAALLGLKQRRVLPVLGGLAVVTVGLAVIAVVGFREGLGRLADSGPLDVSLGARIQLNSAALSLWQRFPLLGTGLGTFPEAVPMVLPAALAGASWTHAHDDVAELLATGGLVGLGLLLWMALATAKGLLSAWWNGSRSEDRAAALAALGAVAGLGLHELVDFGLTMPANAFVLAVLCGGALGVRLKPAAPIDRATT
ncbi:MAG: O-antigen ligase family protein [Acidobacteriota bacterium]